MEKVVDAFVHYYRLSVNASECKSTVLQSTELFDNNPSSL